jgi:hypothetical protein
MCGHDQTERRQAVTKAVTAISCAALLWTSHAVPAGKPQPGTRTAVELIASASQRILLKPMLLHVT